MEKRISRIGALLLALLFLFAAMACVYLECAHMGCCQSADCIICRNVETYKRGALALLAGAVFLRSIANGLCRFLNGALRSRVPFLSPVASMVRMND